MKKNDLLYQAAFLFLKHGYQKYTLDELAIELKVGKGTLYKLYGDKKSLIKAVLKERKELLFSLLKPSHEESKNALDSFFRIRRTVNQIVSIPQQRQNLLELKKAYPDLYDKAIRDVKDIASVSFLTVYDRGVNEGLFRKENNDLIGEHYAKLYLDYRLDEKFSDPDVLIQKANDAELLFIKGLLTAKGQLIFDQEEAEM